MHRFFVAPSALQHQTVTLTGPQAHQIAVVLRLRPGERIVVLDNSGWQYLVELQTVTPQRVVGRIGERSLATTEPRVKLTLYQGLIRAPKFELVLQKCTEIGVVAFVPVLCARSLVTSADETRPAKFERWQRIIAEAAEQSGRGKLPVLHPVTTFGQACRQARGLALLAHERAPARPLRAVLQTVERPFAVSLFIGPEGGFAPEEVAQAQDYGIVPVALGPRILRAETAAIVATALVLYTLGDMDEPSYGG